MNILVACEESQRVCIAFREKGHNAFSCDLQSCSGGHPEWHIMTDVLPLLNGNCSFITCDGLAHKIVGKWDLIIAHPPCTRLCLSSQRWLYTSDKFYNKNKISEQQKSIVFFMHFVYADCDRIAIENPVGIMSSAFRKPDCIYNPYDFLDETECKQTCLWLKGLPPLKSNRVVPLPVEFRTHNMFKAFPGSKLSFGSSELSRLRSITPLGVAKAMADQWG